MTKLNELRKLIIESEKDLFTKGELLGLGYNNVWMKYALNALVMEKQLYRIKNGVYSKTNPNSLDLFKTATTLFGGYIGLSTAVYVYGWTDEYQYTIFVLTDKTSKRIILGSHEIRAISIGKRFLGSCYFNNYVLSTKPKTVFDLLYFTSIVGKESVEKYLENARLSKAEWNEFIEYCLNFGSKSFRQKAGYIIEKISIKVPDAEKLMPKNPVVVKLGNGRLDKKWMVIGYG